MKRKGQTLEIMLPPDELDDLDLSLFNIKQVETVVLTHGEDLTSVDDPDQLDDSTEMKWTVNTTEVYSWLIIYTTFLIHVER